MMPAYTLGEAVVAFTLTGTAMLLLVMLVSWLVRPLRRRPEAEQTYECGMVAKGEHRHIGFGFIGYAALFLAFDVAAVYLFLLVAAPREPGILMPLLIAAITLALMVVYGTRRRKYHVA